jgi:hypothetical protein
MIVVPRSCASSPSNPTLTALVRSGGFLVDPHALSYQILDASTEALRAAPAVVYPDPAHPETWATVNLVTGRLSLGHFVAEWTPTLPSPGDPEHDPPILEVLGDALGRHVLRMKCELTESRGEWTWDQWFDLVSTFPPNLGPFYCDVSDLRDEGVTVPQASEAWLLVRIALASKMIESWTGRHFEPRVQEIRLDGKNSPVVPLDPPIIALESVSIEDALLGESTFGAEAYRVYNRHLTEGLLSPDDRENPRLEISTEVAALNRIIYDPTRWPAGSQNVIVRGAFGYTDPDGSPAGCLPELLRHAAKLLVLRELSRMSDVASRDDAVKRSRIRSESTGSQSYSVAGVTEMRGLSGNFTGDPEIDMLVAQYVRPPSLGAV